MTKWIASDFDKTIYFPHNMTLTKANVQGLNFFTSQCGGGLIIATARSPFFIVPIFKALHLQVHNLISANGALICDADFNILEHKPISQKELLQIKKVLSSFKIDFAGFDGYSETSLDCKEPKYSICIADRNQLVLESLKEFLESNFELVCYIESGFLMANRKDTSKRKGLEFLIDVKGISQNELFLAGDNNNDISMIAGFPNATPELKAVAPNEIENVYSLVYKILSQK